MFSRTSSQQYTFPSNNVVKTRGTKFESGRADHVGITKRIPDLDLDISAAIKNISSDKHISFNLRCWDCYAGIDHWLQLLHISQCTVDHGQPQFGWFGTRYLCVSLNMSLRYTDVIIPVIIRTLVPLYT